MFRHHRRRVRKVVLDRDGLPARQAGSDFFRKRRGKIPRVEVARHGLRPDAENPLHPLQPGPVVALHAVVFKVAEILAEVGPVARKQAEAAFQVAAGGQRRPGCGDAQHHRQRHIAPAAPQDLRRSAENAGDGIVQRGADGAGVVQDAAEQRGTDLRHAAVFMDDRFGRGVAAGHDQRAAGVREQAVQARRGEKSAQEAAVAADSGTERLPRLFEQDDGPCGGRNQRLFLRAHPADLPHVRRRRKHHGERLFLPAFQPAQAVHRPRIAGQADVLVAADPLDGDHGPAFQQGDAPPQGLLLFTRSAPAVKQKLGAALPARDGLGMAAAAGAVFLRAAAAHREIPHRRVLPVVGERIQDAEPRPAGGAADERIPEPPVLRVQHLAQAVAADGQVRRKDGRPLFRRRLFAAAGDGKAVEAALGNPPGRDVQHDRAGGAVLP